MRLFVAIYPPPEALDDVADQTNRLRLGAASAAGINVRLAPRSNLHVTVAFLGEVADERLRTVEDALTRAVQDRHCPPVSRRGGGTATRGRRGTAVPGAPEVPVEGGAPESGPAPPRLRLGGGGRFGRGRFTVLWVGLLGEVDAVHRLATAIRRELRRARVPHDFRPLRPHLTLARPGERLDRASLDEDLRTLDGYLGPSWPATEMVLVRSHLGPRPTYDRLATWDL
ncbi:2'-5' RNA ligase family protein [Plantactinospora sp. S1510]|uniref:RNA 2',3'-cyclic phosphodiesterase n=1 Tax=Plantactinospora alkalitolerans TaxID=2789879 RepID=A0ABS0H2Q4_9ACTN|nr:2'-5' RNA ligase family protein [Plantactinospora alkalitolerans]MBF9132571.1 2'-5' RNA ligase family protein [Plantactinospora alkalitolerans]